MAENKRTSKQIKNPDLELLTHKYSDWYPDYYMYDVREIDYPAYKTKVVYDQSRGQCMIN